MARQTSSITALALLGLLSGGLAFQVPLVQQQPQQRQMPRPLQASSSGSEDRAAATSRREILQSTAAVLGALGVAGLAGMSPASAASPVISELKIRESVKGVKDSVEALKLYEDFVQQKDFYGIKKSLRVPPVSEIRRDCRRIIAGLDGQVKGDTDKAYGKFIQALEEVDLIATRAIQAQQNDQTVKDEDVAQLGVKYGQTQAYLQDVLDLVLTTRYAEPVNVRLETAAAPSELLQ